MNYTIKINNKNLRIMLTILLAIITVVAGYLYYKEISNKNKTT